MNTLTRVFIVTTLVCAPFVLLDAQTARFVGYVSQADNRGFLNEAEVTLTDLNTGGFIGTTTTNEDGVFESRVPIGSKVLVRIEKKVFEILEDTIEVTVAADQKMFAKFKMKRKPGYLFEVTMASKPGFDLITPAINKSDIEIYNHTTDEMVFEKKNYDSPFFSYTFERGNHYILLIRAPGYETKRMEAHVDIDGCILCFEGVGGVRPGVSDNLTAGHLMGTLLANVQLLPAAASYKDPYNNKSLTEIVRSEKGLPSNWDELKAQQTKEVALRMAAEEAQMLAENAGSSAPAQQAKPIITKPANSAIVTPDPKIEEAIAIMNQHVEGAIMDVDTITATEAPPSPPGFLGNESDAFNKVTKKEAAPFAEDQVVLVQLEEEKLSPTQEGSSTIKTSTLIKKEEAPAQDKVVITIQEESPFEQEGSSTIKTSTLIKKEEAPAQDKVVTTNQEESPFEQEGSSTIKTSTLIKNEENPIQEKSIDRAAEEKVTTLQSAPTKPTSPAKSIITSVNKTNINNTQTENTPQHQVIEVGRVVDMKTINRTAAENTALPKMGNSPIAANDTASTLVEENKQDLLHTTPLNTEVEDSIIQQIEASSNGLNVAMSGGAAAFDENAADSIEKILVINELPNSFTGYAVQLLGTKGELSEQEKQKLKQLPLLYTTTRGVYKVVLTGTFETRIEAEAFRVSSVAPLFPQAYIVRYENGQRL